MKTAIYFLLTLMLLMAPGCEVDVPARDDVPPTFALQIMGDGFDHTFKSEDDFSSFRLHLDSGTDYSFVFSGGDGGGLGHLRWNWVNGLGGNAYVHVPDSDIPNGWSVAPDNHAWFIGRREDARSGAIITGRLRAYETYGDEPMVWQLFAEDFGGTARDRNSWQVGLQVVVADQPTDLVPVD